MDLQFIVTLRVSENVENTDYVEEAIRQAVETYRANEGLTHETDAAIVEEVVSVTLPA